jgi:hypothetical protein
VDYKTGRLPGPKDSETARNAQMPLYVAAIESLLDRPALGGVFHSLRGDPPSFFAAMKKHGAVLRTNQDFAKQRQAAMEAIARAIEGMRSGRYDLLPADKRYCPHCPYRRACQFSPARDELLRTGNGEDTP